MKSYPKKKRTQLTPKEYTKLRQTIYEKQRCRCAVCGFWFSFDEISLHHIKSRGAGGPDTETNCIAACLNCHAKLHSGIK